MSKKDEYFAMMESQIKKWGIAFLRSADRFDRRFSGGVLLFLAGAIALIASIAAPRDGWAKTDAKPDVEAISNRADLVSGGDVLLRVTLPPGLSSKAVLSLNGRSASKARSILHPTDMAISRS